ncbi:NAD(P)H-hydrate dehydratase [Nesterenkonia flava]|nr:NAD(P)H-hydrate dehydratase [Nesterenkonia flava]
MRRAAWGLAQHVLSLLGGQAYGRRVVGLIGSGNNGGDGLWALALLRRRGVDARAVLVRQRAHPEGLAAFRAAGGRVVQELEADADVVIDAILGTGFRGEFQAPELPDRALVVACDLPSGVDADTGQVRGTAIQADHTVTFGGLKTGLLVGEGGLRSGQLHLVDIGLGPQLPPPDAHCVAAGAARETMGEVEGDREAAHDTSRTPMDSADLREVSGAPVSQAATLHMRPPVGPGPLLRGPAPGAHKYSRGTVHVVAGSAQYPGAAVLSVGATVRTGVGMVTFQTAQQAADRVISSFPEAVAAAEPSRASAVVVGPGLGEDPAQLLAAQQAIRWAVQEETPCVVDASALALVPQLKLSQNILLTPHLGEMRRLLRSCGHPDLLELLSTDPLQAVRSAAERLQATLLLKGPTTIIASPGGTPILHRGSTPGLATAGSGDVLAGILGAVTATQKAPIDQLAAAAAARHVQAARLLDPHGTGAFGAAQLLEALTV